MAANLLATESMNWKPLVLSAVFFASLPAMQAADPISYREIAMLLRNGENQQFIIDDTVRRKLLQPLSEEEVRTLASLNASPALLNLLHDPATLASSQAAAAYETRMQQQKIQALRDAQLAQQTAAENARLLQQQKSQPPPQQQQPAKPAAGATDPSAGYVGKPLTLKFTAADGSVVDLDKYRGKVVLVDFWATWCGPCMKEVPNVVAAYNKYHAKGFEVVGISLDQDKDKMLKVTAQKGMTWPQYFDGKGWNNEVSTAFKIRAIPAMWLVNKNGLIATTDARAGLDDTIAKLLAE